MEDRLLHHFEKQRMNNQKQPQILKFGFFEQNKFVFSLNLTEKMVIFSVGLKNLYQAFQVVNRFINTHTKTDVRSQTWRIKRFTRRK